MNLPGWRFHQPEGKRLRYSVRVDKNWGLTFEFEGRDAVLVDYQDYH
jgi:proteic killer suppression protein